MNQACKQINDIMVCVIFLYIQQHTNVSDKFQLQALDFARRTSAVTTATDVRTVGV